MVGFETYFGGLVFGGAALDFVGGYCGAFVLGFGLPAVISGLNVLGFDFNFCLLG